MFERTLFLLMSSVITYYYYMGFFKMPRVITYYYYMNIRPGQKFALPAKFKLAGIIVTEL
jgi:hypothetical protein